MGVKQEAWERYEALHTQCKTDYHSFVLGWDSAIKQVKKDGRH